MRILALEMELENEIPDNFDQILKEEAKVVWDLQKNGVIRQINFRPDFDTAVIEMECASLEEAEQVLNTLPLVKSGLIAFDYFELVPYTGFERLFEK